MESCYSGLSKRDKRKVFSGLPVPKEWMPNGLPVKDLPGDYVRFVPFRGDTDKGWLFTDAGDGLVRAHETGWL